ncbi:MAG: homocysteine S-methyltransferase family protein [Ignavibacteriaceae bacterium]|nr:homocysteine S-methyltransferase family protein [Ignavibacteriaceae bacterium]
MNNLPLISSRFEEVTRTGKPLLLDGAVGSLLIQRLGEPRSKIWASQFNETHPEEVIKLHKDYITAGADIITTNTFRTNPAYREHEKDEISRSNAIRTGVLLAQEARGASSILIAGSNAPAEDCYQAERTLSHSFLEKNHKVHISKLMEYGADFILNETQSHTDEIEIITQFCASEKIPYGISLYFTPNLKLLSGEDILPVINRIREFDPLFISFNCVSIAAFDSFISQKLFPFRWGFYLNCGTGKATDIILECGIEPDEYASLIRRYLELRPVLIGACCGSNPAHIRSLRKLIDEDNH